MTGRAARLLREERGQAVVELACVVPVVLACALVAVNLGVYIERCARFDRVAPDMVLAHGIAPADEQDASSAVRQVREAVGGVLHLGRHGLRRGHRRGAR